MDVDIISVNYALLSINRIKQELQTKVVDQFGKIFSKTRKMLISPSSPHSGKKGKEGLFSELSSIDFIILN